MTGLKENNEQVKKGKVMDFTIAYDEMSTSKECLFFYKYVDGDIVHVLTVNTETKTIYSI